MAEHFGSRRGTSITEVVVASALAAGLAITVAQISKKSAQNNAHVQSETTLANLRNQLSVSGADPVEWMAVLRDNVTTIRSCLTAPGPYVCPPATNVASNSILTAEATGRTISSVDLFDLAGQRIAGASGGEVYFDRDGGPCASASPAADPRCMYRATGYMIRQNLNPVPDAGQITFIRMIEQTAQTVTKESTQMTTLYEKVSIGRAWSSRNLNGPEVGTILSYAGDASAVPTGFLLADGSAVLISEHPQLYAILGTTWGAAPVGQFRLPDLRGTFVRGSSPTIAVGTRQAADVASHTHNIGIFGQGIVNVTHVPVRFDSYFPSGLSGARPYFNAGGGYDGHLGYGTLPGLTVYGTNQITGVNSTVSGGTININVTSFSGTATGGVLNGSSGETRPSNSAVLYIVRDDYE